MAGCDSNLICGASRKAFVKFARIKAISGSGSRTRTLSGPLSLSRPPTRSCQVKWALCLPQWLGSASGQVTAVLVQKR